jgi:hypothetical protein
MDRSLFLELIHQTQSILDTIQNSAQLSREKFVDKASGDFFNQMITGNIDKIDLLLDGFLHYIKSTTPIIKKDTVKVIFEELLRKHQIQLSEKKIRILKKYGKDIPDTIVPDEQLRFILNSILQYAIAALSMEGSIEISTSYRVLADEADEEKLLFLKDNRNVEIMITFSRLRRMGEHVTAEFALPSPKRELDLLLRLVHTLVQKNRGRMAYEVNKMKTKRMISLRFPAERRKGTVYQLSGRSIPLE